MSQSHSRTQVGTNFPRPGTAVQNGHGRDPGAVTRRRLLELPALPCECAGRQGPAPATPPMSSIRRRCSLDVCGPKLGEIKVNKACFLPSRNYGLVEEIKDMKTNR